jgi:hypothetical protein
MRLATSVEDRVRADFRTLQKATAEPILFGTKWLAPVFLAKQGRAVSMSDYHDALRQLQQRADEEISSGNRPSVLGIGSLILRDKPLQWAIALLVTMVLFSLVP